MNQRWKKAFYFSVVISLASAATACSALSGMLNPGASLTTTQGGGVPYGLKVNPVAPTPESALYGVFPAPQ